ncbi:hypothetical protein QZH56_18060 [Streptomyces olivoreticuli]|uniref:hypothetical protein n=1 Tax=Streptomyces olivoreticuli TaxID=68246 RepID=UPI002659498F|nr:hypothetical protein [Streptomyces olivoreticuli]WKK20817.1 hypothetical protein QZH56_18060 [Streptomyces olivoreticuli]
MAGTQRDTGTLETAARALAEAQTALDQARHALTAAIVAARRAGTPLSEIATRAGRSTAETGNTLDATGRHRHDPTLTAPREAAPSGQCLNRQG